MTERTPNRYATALRHRDLRALILAFVVDGAGSWSYNVILIAYVFERTQSAGWITALVSVRWLAGMVFGGYAGVLADRFDRRLVLLASCAAATAVMIVLTVIVAVDAPLALLLIASALLTAVCTPVRPTSGALVPEVVSESDLVAANSIFALLESVIVVIGPGVGALLLLTGDAVYGMLLNTASFIVAGLLYASLGVRVRGSAEPGGRMLAQWREGVSALASHRLAFVLTMFLVLDSAAINAGNVLLPALSQHLGGGSTGYSLLLAANALGGVVVAGVANKLAGSSKLATIIMAAIVLECLPLWLAYFAHVVAGALVLMILSGVGMVIVDVLAFTALQRDLPRAVLGRVLGSIDVLLLGSSVLATVVTGQLYAHVGLGWALGVLGIGFPALAMLGLPALRVIDVEAAAAVARLGPRVQLLELLDLFAGAPRAALEQLAGSAEPEVVPAGVTLISQGSDADAFWVLAEGELAISAVRADGIAVELPPVGAPGYVGEIGLLHRQLRSATVVTATECRLLKIPGDSFLAVLEDSQPSPTMLSRVGVRLARTAPVGAAIEG